MNSLNVKAKLQMGQFKRLKQIFCKFAGQSDLEGQGQGRKSCCIHKKSHTILEFLGQFDLEGQGHQF